MGTRWLVGCVIPLCLYFICAMVVAFLFFLVALVLKITVTISFWDLTSNIFFILVILWVLTHLWRFFNGR